MRDGVAVGIDAGRGIYVSGIVSSERTLLEGNQVEGNAGCGIQFDTTASGSAYRNNMLRGNTGGAICDAGSGNTNAGGNIS